MLFKNASVTALIASSTVVATVTPLPAASPSCFITIGTPFLVTYAIASSWLVKETDSAVGMLNSLQKSLQKVFELSNCAAAWLGPNTVILSFSKSLLSLLLAVFRVLLLLN